MGPRPMATLVGEILACPIQGSAESSIWGGEKAKNTARPRLFHFHFQSGTIHRSVRTFASS